MKSNGEEIEMTMEEKRLQHLYDLLERLENDHHSDPDEIATLRWAIFELEQKYNVN